MFFKQINVFYAALLLIPLGLISGGLFLVYLLVRMWLERKQKSLPKWAKRTFRTFIFIPLFLPVVLLISEAIYETKRPPIRDIIEHVGAIRLPADPEIIRDEYQDMFMDYCRLYEVRLKTGEMPTLIHSIQTKPYYGQATQEDSLTFRLRSNLQTGDQGIWYSLPKGYGFKVQKNGVRYWIELDTTARVLSYKECGYS